MRIDRHSRHVLVMKVLIRVTVCGCVCVYVGCSAEEVIHSFGA